MSVRPSVTHVFRDKTKKHTADILIPHERAIILVMIILMRLIIIVIIFAFCQLFRLMCLCLWHILVLLKVGDAGKVIMSVAESKNSLMIIFVICRGFRYIGCLCNYLIPLDSVLCKVALGCT